MGLLVNENYPMNIKTIDLFRCCYVHVYEGCTCILCMFMYSMPINVYILSVCYMYPMPIDTYVKRIRSNEKNYTSIS